MVGARNTANTGSNHLQFKKSSTQKGLIFMATSPVNPPAAALSGMLKDDALKGKTIIITGGGTGLGKAMGSYFLQLGANLVITSRKLDVLQQTAAEMETQTGGKVLAVACDVRNYEEVEKMLHSAIETFGRVDVVVNNA